MSPSVCSIRVAMGLFTDGNITELTVATWVSLVLIYMKIVIYKQSCIERYITEY